MKRAGWAAAPMLIIPLPSAWRSVFSWCERARDLVGPGILKHPRLRHGLATAVRARVLDFFNGGSTPAATGRRIKATPAALEAALRGRVTRRCARLRPVRR